MTTFNFATNQIKTKSDIQEDAILATLVSMGVEKEKAQWGPQFEQLREMEDEELIQELVLTDRESDLPYYIAIQDELLDREEDKSGKPDISKQVWYHKLEIQIRKEMEEQAMSQLEQLDHLGQLCWLLDFGGPGMPGWESFLYLRSGDGDEMDLGLEEEEEMEEKEAIEAEFFEAFNPPWKDHPDLK